MTHKIKIAELPVFDMAAHLPDEQAIAEYLTVVLEENDPVVYKRLPIILAITILMTAAAAFYSYRQQSIYQAKTSLIIEPRRPPQTQKEAININFGDDQKYYNTQLQLLRNQGLMKHVVIALGLQRDANLLGDGNRGIFATIRSLFSGGEKKADTENVVPVITESSVTSNKSRPN